MDVNVYEGRFGEEMLLLSDDTLPNDALTILPQKGDFIHYNGEVYKVMYAMVDVDNEEYAIFVRKAIEEDF